MFGLLVITGLSVLACSKAQTIALDHGCGPCEEPTGEVMRFSGLTFPDIEVSAPPPGAVLVYGYVRAKADSLPLNGVQVAIPGTGLVALSNKSGSYQVEVPDSLDLNVTFQTIGYTSESLPVEMTGESLLRIDVELGSCPICLDG